MKKVCFVQHATEWPLFNQIAISLKNKGYESVFVCKTRSVYEKYKELGYESFYVSDIFNHTDKIDEKDLVRLDQQYGSPSIFEMGDSDVQLVDLFESNFEEKNKVIGLSYLFWEDFFEKNKIDYVLMRDVATFLTRPAYNYCKKNNIPFGQIAIGPGDEYFSIDDIDESHMWSELMEEVQKGYRKLNNDQDREVNDFIEGRINSIKEKMQLRFVPDSLLKTTKNFFGMYFHDTKRKFKYDPIKVAALRHGRKRLFKKIIWKYITKNFLNYQEPDLNEKYVYFPVYSGEETSYLVNTHYWARNEKSLIKEVAYNLPQGYKLYVKEHPTNPGDLTFKELKELSKIPNIKILRPTVDATELIRNSQMVCVLLGTTGWEAFLSKVPVVVLGNTFFSYSNLVYKVESMSNFSKVIWKALRTGKDIYEKNIDEWKWFIYSAISTSGKGKIVNLIPPYGFVTDQKNAENIASVLLKKIEN